MGFSLSRTLDVDAIAHRFADEGYASVPGVLEPDGADRMLSALREWQTWNVVFNDRGKHIDMSRVQFRSLPPDSIAQLRAAIYTQGARDFQYFYENYPIYDAQRQGRNKGQVLHEFYEWLDTEPFLEFARAVTGFDDIDFVDAQATRYGPGHFLTTHDDSAAGKNRRAAYVFNFTPEWRPDWGGYLQLLDGDGHVRKGLRPGFNTLNLLSVPQPHNVGFVAPFAAAQRLSVTGWLRYGRDDD